MTKAELVASLDNGDIENRYGDDLDNFIRSLLDGVSFKIGSVVLQYLEVTVTTAQILALGGALKQLLPAPGVNKYYQYYGVLENNKGATAFLLAPEKFFFIGENNYSGLSHFFSPSFLDYDKTVTHFGSTNIVGAVNGLGGGEPVGWYQGSNQAINLGIVDGTNPINGNGSFLVKIWYKVRTIGTEL